MSENYEFQLTPEELFWLAKAFQINSLRLPQNPLAKFGAHETKEILNRAQESLNRRSLIQPSDGGAWQVDRLPAAIVRWLGSEVNMLTLEAHTPNGVSRYARVFSEHEVDMFVKLDRDGYHFVFLQDREATSTYLLDWFDASFLHTKIATEKYMILQPVTIMRSAWNDPALATKMLTVTGQKPKDIKSILAWMKTLEWVLTFNRVDLEEEKARIKSQTIFCGNKQKAWSGDLDQSSDDAVMLSPINLESIRSVISNLL